MVNGHTTNEAIEGICLLCFILILGVGKPPSRLLISPTHRGASGREKNLSRAGKGRHNYLHPTPTLPLFFLSVLALGSGVLGGGKPPRRLLICPWSSGSTCGVGEKINQQTENIF